MANTRFVSFSGKFIETIVTDRACIADSWVHDIFSKYNGQDIIVGLDCEWKPDYIRGSSNKTATLQLCVDTKCLILQLFYMDYIPQSIKNFLRDPNITFVGVEVEKDLAKLSDDYGFSCTRVADIQALAKSRFPLLFNQKAGLKDLAYHVVGLVMAKPQHVCMSDWETRVLDEQQIEYACIDAYASYRIGHKLLKEM